MNDTNEMVDGRIYGDHTFTGEDSDFFEKPLEEQVRLMGWSHACPSIDNVIKAYGDEWLKDHPGATEEEILKAGMEKTLARYAECNFVFGLIAEAAKDNNPELYKQLTNPVPRILPEEPDGDHGKKYVPLSHEKQMSPLSTPWGFALPRVLIEEMGRGENNIERTPERMLKVLEYIEAFVPTCNNPVELVVKLSEVVANDLADPKMVVYHLLSADIYKEENCASIFKDIISEMERSAPTISALYKSLSGQERKDLGVVDF